MIGAKCQYYDSKKREKTKRDRQLVDLIMKTNEKNNERLKKDIEDYCKKTNERLKIDKDDYFKKRMNMLYRIIVIVLMTIGLIVSVETLDNYLMYDRIFISIEYINGKLVEFEKCL